MAWIRMSGGKTTPKEINLFTEWLGGNWTTNAVGNVSSNSHIETIEEWRTSANLSDRTYSEYKVTSPTLDISKHSKLLLDVTFSGSGAIDGYVVILLNGTTARTITGTSSNEIDISNFSTLQIQYKLTRGSGGEWDWPGKQIITTKATVS